MKNIFWLRTGPKMSKIGQFKGKKGKNVSKICQEIIEIGLLLPLSESKDAALPLPNPPPLTGKIR